MAFFNGVEAYVRFRKQGLAHAEQAVVAQIQASERAITDGQNRLVQNRFNAAPAEQGLLETWNDLRPLCEAQIQALAAQPWLEQIEVLNRGQTLQIIGRRQNGSGRLMVALEKGALDIQWPLFAGDGASELIELARNALVAEGLLAAAVELCAAQAGIALTSTRKEPPRIDRRASEAYYRQRSAWLSEHVNSQAAKLSDPQGLVRQLNEQHRTIYLLERRLAAIRRRLQDPGQPDRFRDEWQQLCALPLVSSLSVWDSTIEVRTHTVHVEGVALGRCLVVLDFANRQIRVHNLTPVRDGDVVYATPHVRMDVPCLGNMATPAAEFLASWDAPHLIGLMLDYLGSYNPNSKYKDLSAWQ